MPQNTVTPFADEVAGGAALSGNWLLRVFGANSCDPAGAACCTTRPTRGSRTRPPPPLPRLASPDLFAFVEPDDRLGERIVVRIAGAADRGLDAGLIRPRATRRRGTRTAARRGGARARGPLDLFGP